MRSITCRGVRAKKAWSIAIAMAMLVSSGGPMFDQTVKAQTAPVGAGFSPQRRRPAVHLSADPDRPGPRGRRPAVRTGTEPGPRLRGCRSACGPSTGRSTTSCRVRTMFGAADQLLPAPDDAAVPPANAAGRRRTRRRRRRDRLAAAHHQQPDRGSDRQQPGGGGRRGRRRVLEDPTTRSARCSIPNIAPDVGPVGAVQPDVHVLRPVLRPRPRPREQGQRHRGHAAAGGRPAVRPTARPTNFMVLTRATNLPGPDGVLGDAPTTSTKRSQPDDAVRRPEPDLHVAPVAPGVPARVRRPTVTTGAPGDRPAALHRRRPAATSATGPRSRPRR